MICSSSTSFGAPTSPPSRCPMTVLARDRNARDKHVWRAEIVLERGPATSPDEQGSWLAHSPQPTTKPGCLDTAEELEAQAVDLERRAGASGTGPCCQKRKRNPT